jgi:hypothetical protein
MAWFFSGLALSSKSYFLAGAAISLSLVHGGPAPRCLFDKQFAVVCRQVEAPKFSVDDIQNTVLKSQLLKVRHHMSKTDIIWL